MGTTDVWRVLRHSGRSGDSFREVFAGVEAKARARYARLATALRQGAVRLISPDGSIEASASVPRLRTRW